MENCVSNLLMPKATAMWLIDHTSLTFDQISRFCNLHLLEIQALADGETSIQPIDPISNYQLTWEDIHACEKDPQKDLTLLIYEAQKKKVVKKTSRYISIAKRHDKPSAIAWILKHHPEINDAQISRLLGTTRATIMNIRNKTHKDMAKITAKSPVHLNLCSQEDLEKTLQENTLERKE